MAKVDVSEKNLESVGQIDLTTKKYLGTLREPAIRAKSALIDTLQKSKISFSEQCEQLESGKNKERLEKKIDRISKDLDVLKTLPEDEVIIFALTTRRNIMALAANKRIPQLVRLKARIASHKPLSTHLARVKNTESNREESDAEEQEVEETSKALDKVTLNNQIVKMRKDVKRAKVHVVHRLTRTISNLRKRKSSDKVIAKCEKKAERLVKKIKCIKKLKPDEVSKFALTTSENLDRLISNIKLPMKTHVMASLSVVRFIAKPVADFKRANPEWNKTVPKILKTKKKKRKLKRVDTNAVKSSNKELDVTSKKSISGDSSSLSECENGSDDEQNVNSDNESNDKENVNSDKESDDQQHVMSDKDSDDQQDVMSDHAHDSGQEESEQGGECSEEEDIFKEKEKRLKNKRDKDDITLSQSENDSSNEVLESRDDIAPTKSKSKANKKRHKELPIPKNKKTKVGSKQFSEGGINTYKIESELTNVKNLPKKYENSPKVVDPFFMTTANEEYVTSQVPAVDEDQHAKSKFKKGESDSWRKQNRFDKFDKRDKWSKSARGNRRPSNFDNHKSQSFNKPYPKQLEKVPNGTGRLVISTGNRKERRKALTNNLQEEKIEKLHPSWEAKKKQSFVASFQGKKVTFD